MVSVAIQIISRDIFRIRFTPRVIKKGERKEGKAEYQYKYINLIKYYAIQ